MFLPPLLLALSGARAFRLRGMDKQELAALQDAAAHEKENVRQVEASGVEAARQLEAAERAEREMEAVLHAQARAAQPARPAPKPPAPHARRPPCPPPPMPPP